jgi:hypothetical protein
VFVFSNNTLFTIAKVALTTNSKNLFGVFCCHVGNGSCHVGNGSAIINILEEIVYHNDRLRLLAEELEEAA